MWSYMRIWVPVVKVVRGLLMNGEVLAVASRLDPRIFVVAKAVTAAVELMESLRGNNKQATAVEILKDSLAKKGIQASAQDLNLAIELAVKALEKGKVG